VDEQTAQKLASTPDLPPAGTPTANYLDDIVPEGDTIRLAAMGKALNDLGGDSEDAPSTLLGANTPEDLHQQASIIPVGATTATAFQDLTGDPDPINFAAMGKSLYSLSGETAPPTLLGGALA
jgi:hypothetical protein